MGHRTCVTYPDSANYFSYVYDLGNRLSSVRELNAATNLLAAFAFDQQDRRATLQKGVATTTVVAITSYGYDAASRLNSLSDNLANTAEDITSSFTYNPVSQITSRTRSNTAYSYAGEAGGLPSFTSDDERAGKSIVEKAQLTELEGRTGLMTAAQKWTLTAEIR